MTGLFISQKQIKSFKKINTTRDIIQGVHIVPGR